MTDGNRTAWYSAASVADHGSAFWLTPDGREVEVTSVGENPYGWDDKVSVGPVVKFSRRGVIGRIEKERPKRELR